MMKKIIVAIDGFSSCGKSTMAKELAKEAGYIYVDTGAMYRAVSLFCMRNGWMDELTLDVNSIINNILGNVFRRVKHPILFSFGFGFINFLTF